MTRTYHAINTRYNIHFNAQVAYNEALQSEFKKIENEDNPSRLLNIYPDNSDTTAQRATETFTTTIDKTTKAIKLHSIKTKPQRSRDKSSDPKYQDWMKKQEYNPFLINTWMLLAKAELHDHNYLQAITTFMYISKIYKTEPEVVAECNLWIARAYTEMGWLYEAEDMFRKIDQAGGIPIELEAMHAAVKANLHVSKEEYRLALPYLEKAINKEKNKTQKVRMRYLLAQLYAHLGEDKKASELYGLVKGLNTPHKYSFNADLQKIGLAGVSSKEAIKQFKKMASDKKNKEYLDQVYYAMGNSYLQEGDTVQAIASYKEAIEKSTRNAYDKSITQVRLGDIYFDQKDFIPAQPNYSEALGGLEKADKDYPRVSHRSSVLDELVVHAKVLEEQDSLQHLASLPEDERMAIIQKKIEDLKKEEKERAKEEQREQYLEEQSNQPAANWDDLMMGNNTAPTQPVIPTVQTGGDVASFYFYNEQTVAQGKIAFQKKWGKRKLEDDWRRRNKAVTSVGLSDWGDQNDESDTPIDGNQASAEEDDTAKIADVYSPEYYLEQLPFTKEAVTASNELIENALFNMGKIYKEKLGDLNLAIDAFTTDVRRFPNTPNLEEIYFQLFMIYMQLDNRELMSQYRSRLITEFPTGIYKTPLSDPNYEWNFKHMAALQDSVYQNTYKAYLASDIVTVRKNYENIDSQYPFGDLMPKFALLNALSYAQTRDVGKLESHLKDLIEAYPKSDVIPLATDIIERIKDGQVLLSDGTPIKSLDWSAAYTDDVVVGDDNKPLQYSDSTDLAYILLLNFPAKSVDRNELLFEVADYNFSNYVVQIHDLSFETDGVTETLQIKGYNKFSDIRTYVNKGFEEDGLFLRIDTTMSIIPISIDNYTNVLPKLGLRRYMAFFNESFGEQLPDLMNYWAKSPLFTKEEELPSIEDEKVEPAVEDVPVEGKQDKQLSKEEVKETIEQKQDVPAKTETVEPSKEKVEIKDEPEQVQVDTKKESDADVNAQQVEGEKEKEVSAEREKSSIAPVKVEEKSIDDNKEQRKDIWDEEDDDTFNKVDETVTKIVKKGQPVIKNPVDGIRTILEEAQSVKEAKLTKEERIQQREEEKLEREHKKELERLEEARKDSIRQTEKILQDSIKEAKRQKAEEKQAIMKAKEDAAKEAIRIREEAQKAKEKERDEKIATQAERRKQLEKERQEKLDAKEKERKALLKVKEKERDELLKVKEKERNERLKIKEQERKQRQKELDEKRKNQKSQRK